MKSLLLTKSFSIGSSCPYCSKEIIRETFQNNELERKRNTGIGAWFAKYVAIGNKEKREKGKSGTL